MSEFIRYSRRAVWSCSVFWGLSNFLWADEPLSLREAIDAVVLADSEVVARKEHYDALLVQGPLYGSTGKPELRVKLEKESLSDDTVLGTAIRWKQDPSNPKWLRSKAYDKEVIVAESKLHMAMVDSRVRLKRGFVKHSFLNEALELAESKLRMREVQLENMEALLSAKAADRLDRLRAKLDVEKVRVEVESLRVQIEVEARNMVALGFSEGFLRAMDSGGFWGTEDNSSIVELENSHPAFRIIAAERTYQSERLLAEKKRGKGLHLSYIQLGVEREDGWSHDAADTRLGVSFGIELPWGRKNELKAMKVDNGSDLAEYEADQSAIRGELKSTYEEHLRVLSRFRRMNTVSDELIGELEMLYVALLDDSNSSNWKKAYDVFSEVAGLKKEKMTLRNQVMVTALDLELVSCSEVLLIGEASLDE